MSEMKQLALLKLQKQIPKTKKELEAFLLGEKEEKKQTSPEVKPVQEHLKAKKCAVVKPEELDGLQSHKEAVEHLKKKKCPETKAVQKKAYVAPAEAPAPALTKSGRPKKEYTEEQREANREKMAKLRAMRGSKKEPKESNVEQSDYVF